MNTIADNNAADGNIEMNTIADNNAAGEIIEMNTIADNDAADGNIEMNTIADNNVADGIIEIRNVTKYYKMGNEIIKALDGITLSVEAGEVCCILGTSGSGKSTLLNLMAGLEKPTRGEILIKNVKIHKLNERQLALFRQRNIGFVFQSYNLLPTLTALENVTLPLIFCKTPKKIRNRRAYEMLKAVGLGKRWRHKPFEMSGGQQQRVSIARAFINNPDVVFADEPTGNLDTKTTLEMMDLITGIAKEKKQTLIVVTHDTEISKYANRVIRLKDGKIESITQNTGDLQGEKELNANEESSRADNTAGVD